MKIWKVAICVVVGILGLAAVTLGFVAEANRVKELDISIIVPKATCVYPNSLTHVIGIAASAFLIATQVIITVTTGSAYCRTKFSGDSVDSNGLVHATFSAISWSLFVPAVVMFLVATFYHYESKHAILLKGGEYTCYVVKEGLFNAASEVALAFAVFGVIYVATVL